MRLFPLQDALILAGDIALIAKKDSTFTYGRVWDSTHNEVLITDCDAKQLIRSRRSSELVVFSQYHIFTPSGFSVPDNNYTANNYFLHWQKTMSAFSQDRVIDARVRIGDGCSLKVSKMGYVRHLTGVCYFIPSFSLASRAPEQIFDVGSVPITHKSLLSRR
jgi:hypothetical protein